MLRVRPTVLEGKGRARKTCSVDATSWHLDLRTQAGNSISGIGETEEPQVSGRLTDQEAKEPSFLSVTKRLHCPAMEKRVSLRESPECECKRG